MGALRDERRSGSRPWPKPPRRSRTEQVLAEAVAAALVEPRLDVGEGVEGPAGQGRAHAEGAQAVDDQAAAALERGGHLGHLGRLLAQRGLERFLADRVRRAGELAVQAADGGGDVGPGAAR